MNGYRIGVHVCFVLKLCLPRNWILLTFTLTNSGRRILLTRVTVKDGETGTKLHLPILVDALEALVARDNRNIVTEVGAGNDTGSLIGIEDVIERIETVTETVNQIVIATANVRGIENETESHYQELRMIDLVLYLLVDVVRRRKEDVIEARGWRELLHEGVIEMLMRDLLKMVTVM
jgi:hypothetical protein